MADVQTYVFNYKEVAEALIKKQGIHEGLWVIYMEFGIAGANIRPRSWDRPFGSMRPKKNERLTPNNG